MIEGATKGARELSPAWTAEVSEYATSLAWSHDGALAAIGAASGEVLVVDGDTGAPRARIDAHPGGTLEVAFCPTERLLATCGQDGTAKLHRADGALVATLPGARGWVEHIAWAPHGRLLAASAGKVVRIWRADGGPHLATEEHESTVTGLAWNPKGTELATSCYGGVHLWRIESGARARHLAWKGSLVSLAWSPDGRVIACGSQDCSVHFWRLSTGHDSAMQGYPLKPKAIAWDKAGALLATSGDANVTVWKFEGRGPEGTKPVALEGHRAAVTDLAFRPEGSLLASGAEDTFVIVWDPRRAKGPRACASLRDQVTRVAWRPKHVTLAATDASGHVAAWAVG